MSKQKTSTRRRKKYGKIMRLSDLPPLEEKFDESLLEEGNRVAFSPSKRKIGIRLTSSGIVIRSRNN